MQRAISLILLGHACLAFASRGHLRQGGDVDRVPNYFRSANQAAEEGGDGRSRAVEPPLRVGSFNIQTLGKRKFSDDFIMMTVQRVIHRYDLILILELMTKDNRYIDKLLRDVNRFAPDGVVYNMTLNDDPNTNEYCAFLYRLDKLKILKSESYSDPSHFYRRPFVVLFETPTLRDVDKLCAVGLHVKPGEAVRELNALAGLHDYVSSKYRVQDVLMMGDFNADCTYVKETDWKNIALWTRTDFTWLIGHDVDTTTNYRKCALDRFVYAGENLNAGIITSSAAAYDYRRDLDVTLEEARAVSDHWPIEVKIRGKMSPVAEKHLTSDTCFIVRDARACNVTRVHHLPADISGFVAMETSRGVRLRNATRHADHVTQSLRALRSVLPCGVTAEQAAAVAYKVAQGALRDVSSYADIPQVAYRTDVLLQGENSEVVVCMTTTVN